MFALILVVYPLQMQEIWGLLLPLPWAPLRRIWQDPEGASPLSLEVSFYEFTSDDLVVVDLRPEFES